MTDLIEVLRGAGLDLVGDPPAAEVVVAGHTVRVTVERSADRSTLTASCPTPGGAATDTAEAIEAIALGAPGDTSIGVHEGRILATRTLVQPTAGAAYDAVFGLAKLAASASRLLLALGTTATTAPAAPERAAGTTPAGPAPADTAPGGPPHLDTTAGGPPHVAISPTPTVAPPPAVTPGPRPAPAAPPVWRPTHRVPAGGLDTFDHPDPTRRLPSRLGPGLDVAVGEWLGAWAHVTCSNGWSAWVDGRTLEPLSRF